MFYTIHKDSEFKTNHHILKILCELLLNGSFQKFFKAILFDLEKSGSYSGLIGDTFKVEANEALTKFTDLNYPNHWLTVETFRVEELLRVWKRLIELVDHSSELLVSDGFKFYAWPNPEKPIEDQIDSAQLLNTVAVYTHIPPRTDDEADVQYSEKRIHYNHNDPDVYVILRNLKAAAYYDINTEDSVVTLTREESNFHHTVTIDTDLWKRLVRTWKVFRIWEAQMISLWYDKENSTKRIY